MQHKGWLAVALVGLTLAAGCGGDNAGTPAAETTAAEETTPTEETSTTEHEGAVQVELAAVNDSGVSGTATLVEGEGDGIPTFTVEVKVDPAGDESRPAHIHDVTCAEYAKIKDFDAQTRTVADTLSNVDQGTSTSTVAGKLAERTTGEYSINVHSSANPFPAIACGDIPQHGP
jgi:hypothetical protein